MIRSYLSILIALFTLPLFSQVDIPEWKKLRYLSEDEMYMEVRSARDFVETDPPEGLIRNVAEFDPMHGVLVRYPFGVPVSVMKEIAEDVTLVIICEDEGEKNEVLSTFNNYGVNLDNVEFLFAKTNSWWVRDYGPWFIFDGNNEPGIVDFPYNRPRPRDNDIPAAVAEYLDVNLFGMNILHTGGNYMTDGLGISSSTDLILEENPSMTSEEVNAKHREYLAIEDYFVLIDPLDDYIKHIDCWGKFLTPNKVILGQVLESDYRYDDFEEVADFFKNTESAWGSPYEVYRVYTPGGNDVTPYTNSLIVNNKVFVPITGSIWDDEALEVYEEALPGYEIIGIYHWGWYNTDALHCRSKGIADLGMLYIDHKPVLGEQSLESSSLQFSAEIRAYSGEDIHSDSVFIHLRKNDGPFDQINLLENQDGQWSVSIAGIDPGDEFEYYISAVDESGRSLNHPFIGMADPHSFSVKSTVNTENTSNNTSVKVYPVPAANTITFEMELTEKQSVKLTIINIYGHKIYNKTYTMPAGLNRLNWNPGLNNGPDLPPGNYLYKIEGENLLATGKFILE